VSHGIKVTDELLDSIVHRITVDKQLELAAFQPRFVIDQVVSSCRFAEQNVTLEPRFLGYALDNLRVRRAAPAPHEDLGASAKVLTSWELRNDPEAEHK
jgi:hypothetical protein